MKTGFPIFKPASPPHVAGVKPPCAEDHSDPGYVAVAVRYEPTAGRHAYCEVTMKAEVIAAILAVVFQPIAVLSQPPREAVDPLNGIDRPFGLGGRACKQYDDTGRLYIYSEGLPDLSVISWMQQSANGTKANVPMPQELAQALPLIPGCMPGKHHAA
jgi:hypothetical protein